MLRFNKRRTQIVMQSSLTECGAAVLASILAFYGRQTSLEELRDKCGIARDGCSISTLINAAHDYGLDAEAYRLPVSDIDLLDRPVIAFWKNSHFIIINYAREKYICINDPSQGEYLITKHEFVKNYSDIIVAFKPSERFEQIRKHSAMRNLLIKYFCSNKKAMIFIMICTIFSTCTMQFPSFINRLFMNGYIPFSGNDFIAICLLLTITAIVLCAGITYLHLYHQNIGHIKLSLVESMRIFRHVICLPVIYFMLRPKSELIALFARSEYVISALFKNIPLLLVNVICVVLCLVTLLFYDYQLAVVSILLCIAYIIGQCILLESLLKYEKSLIAMSANLVSQTLYAMRNIESIKASGSELTFMNKWRETFLSKSRYQMSQMNVVAFYDVLMKVSGYVTFLFLLGYMRIYDFNIVDMIFIQSMHLYLLGVSSQILQASRELRSLMIPYSRIQDTLSVPVDQRYLNNATNLSHTSYQSGEITFRNVAFRYGRFSNNVVENLSLHITPGSHVAFVGPSGSGKSTIARLCAGLYTATAGSIMLNNLDIKQLSISELSSMVSYMSQDVSLFAGSVLDNLTVGSDSVCGDTLKNVIEQCCLTQLIKDIGLNGRIEEGGRNLSGGERQRINLARALLRNTPILVLDEATSALDPEMESVLIHYLQKTGKTIIFIAHRLSSIKHCDQIYIIHDGLLVEQGRHDELLKYGGHYHLLNQHNDEILLQTAI